MLILDTPVIWKPLMISCLDLLKISLFVGRDVFLSRIGQQISSYCLVIKNYHVGVTLRW